MQFFLPIAHPRSLGWTIEKRHSGWQFINRLARRLKTVFLQSNEEMWKTGKLNPSWMVTGGNEPNKTMSAAAPWRMYTTIPLTPEWKYYKNGTKKTWLSYDLSRQENESSMRAASIWPIYKGSVKWSKLCLFNSNKLVLSGYKPVCCYLSCGKQKIT